MMRLGSERARYERAAVPSRAYPVLSEYRKPITARPRSTPRLRRQGRDGADNITCCSLSLTSYSSPWVNSMFWMNVWMNSRPAFSADTCGRQPATHRSAVA